MAGCTEGSTRRRRAFALWCRLSARGGHQACTGPGRALTNPRASTFQFRLFSCPLLNEPALGMGFVQ